MKTVRIFGSVFLPLWALLAQQAGREANLTDPGRRQYDNVLDRTNGELLLGRPFVKKLTWATGIAADGRPIRNPDQETAGAKVCPSQSGASNWFSTSYNPSTGLYYVQTLEKCTIFTKRAVEWEAGRGYLGGNGRNVPDATPQKILRAIDIRTGRIAWELPQTGPASTWGGTLTTATGLVFYGDDGGLFAAVDAATGKPLWHFQTNQNWKASPMTYAFDGQQYLAVGSGTNVLAFGLMQ